MILAIKKYVFANSTKNESTPYIFITLWVHLIIRALYCILFFDVFHLIINMALSFVGLCLHVILERSRLNSSLVAFLLPTTIIIFLTTYAFFISDVLIFAYVIGGAMISLTYMKPKGLFAYIIVISTFLFALLTIFNVTLLGTAYSMMHNYINLIVTILLNIMLYQFCKSHSNLLLDLRKARHEANKASDAKSDFLTTMSHEIRTPMNAILGIAQIQLQNENLTTEESTVFQKIYSSGITLLGIINDILDMSKIETGRLELVPVDYDVPTLINDTVQLNIVRIGYKPINFILDIDENLPQMLRGDDLRIKQILNNLLSNAIKYTKEGHIKFTVKYIDKDMLQFIVEDTGQGMKKKDLEMLFRTYTRFNIKENRTIEGTGIGLTIVERLVKMMDGIINVKSEYGKGSIFMVVIKQQKIDSPPIGKEIAQKLSNFTFASKIMEQIIYKSMPYGKLLIVDDSETNLYVALGLLEPYKVLVETVTNGFDAIENIKKGKTYDIIFMDHMMPKMDGIETMQKLRNMGYKGNIIALTANVLAGNDEIFLSKGFDFFLSKPIDIQQLDNVMSKFVYNSDYNSEEFTQLNTQIHHNLISAFLRDAKNAVNVIEKTYKTDNMSLFITTVHAMKSALANIQEYETSKIAKELEDAGNIIRTNTDILIKKLEKLIELFNPKENNDTIEEDTILLKQQMQIIKTACEEYDDTKAYAAIDILKEKSWSSKTLELIEKIYVTIRLHSEFEKAAEMADIDNY